jgi:hypothetical protein
MWQDMPLNSSIALSLIQNQQVWFQVSAWIGGYLNQDDNARLELTFQNRTRQSIGNVTTLGPVSASDRGYQSALLFRRAIGRVPVAAVSVRVQVVFTRLGGNHNDGAIDNIELLFYR